MKDTCVSKLIRSAVLLVIAFLVFSDYALTPNRSTVSAQTANWTKLTSPTSEPLRSVHFLNENEGWAAGANATLLRTTNGGVSWTLASTSFATEVKDFRSVKFINANVGWLGGSNGYARTADGGASWVETGIILDIGGVRITPFNAFVPLSETQIRFAGAGLMGPTRVGAAVTSEINAANPAGAPRLFDVLPISPSNPSLSRHVNDFSVVPGVGAWYVMDDGGAARTQGTGGAGFVGMSLTSPINLYGVQMLNGTLGYAVGANGTVLKTSGGTSWATQTSGVTQTLRALHFLDTQRGWVVGDGGTILSTTDGGATWKKESSGTTENLNAVWAANATTIYVVGANGTILKQGAAAPAALASVSAASYSGATLAPESIAVAFGANLSATTAIASTQPLPTELAGVSVKVRDSAGVERNAPLFFVSPGQINYQVPEGSAPGAATVAVVNNGGTVIAQGNVALARLAPGLFAANANGQGVPAGVVLRIRANGTQVYEPLAQFDAVQNRWVAVPIDLGLTTDQVFLVLYGTGLRNRNALTSVAAKLGGADAEAIYAGAAPGFVGVDQLNLRVARTLIGRGDADMALTVEGLAANSLRVNIK